jgi:CRISPR system Cascade subunit CasB
MTEVSKLEFDPVWEAVRWWQGLQDTREDGTPNPSADRGSRARLRRADRESAMTEEAVLDLYRRLAPGTTGFDAMRMRLSVRLALVLVHVRPHGAAGKPKRFAEQLGRSSYSAPIEDAAMKPLRFRRLLAARDEDEIVREFRRALDLVGNKADVRDLTRLLLRWERDKTRTRFAFDYFAGGSAEPVPSASGDSAA